MGNTDVRNVQVDVQWQVLRASTLSPYNTRGGWGVPRATLGNLEALHDYIDAGDGTYNVRLFRVRKLLGAVLTDHFYPKMRQALLPHPAAQADREFTGSARMVEGYLETLSSPGKLTDDEKTVDWDKTLRDLKALLVVDITMYNNVRKEVTKFTNSSQGRGNDAMMKLSIMMREVANAA